MRYDKPVMLRFPAGLLEKVKEVSEEQGSRPADFMRRAIIKALREEEKSKEG